ncbi:MAG: hypothetical protein OCU12_06130 [Methanophagales archaeon]|nr:hypothetical protein [Methanophagales archaeon]
MSLEGLIRELARLRAREKDIKESIADVEAAIENTPLGQELIKHRSHLSVVRLAVGQADESVRAAALERFAEIGEKKVHPAVSVVESTVLSYDTQEALDYAMKAGLSQVLSLKRREFEKVAKVLPLDFVETGIVHSVRIKRDLSGWLDG